MPDNSTAVPTYEYSAYFRFVLDGKPGPLNRRFFPTARLALAFLSRLDAVDPPQNIFTTIARREVGTWEFVDLATVEADAAEEVGR
jgi:hypothetical protein